MDDLVLLFNNNEDKPKTAKDNALAKEQRPTVRYTQSADSGDWTSASG